MNRRVWYVKPHTNGWIVVEQGSGTGQVFPTKDAAIAYGRKIASQHAPSQLKVMRQDGTFQDEATYGQDPYPPKG